MGQKAKRFQDRVVIVTGASSGIGRATALLFADEGARVALAARSREKLESLAKEIRSRNGTCLAIPTDVSDRGQVFSMVDQVLQQWGRIDILVNNAGIGFQGLFSAMPLEDFDRVLEVNLFGCAYCASAVMPAMIRQKRGQIINVSSLLGKRGFPGSAAYCASKFALCGFSQSLRAELAPYGVSVLSFLPGLTDTPFFEHLLPSGGRERPARRGMSIEPVAREILDAAWKNKREVLLTPRAKAIIWLNNLFPAVADYLHAMKYHRQLKAKERQSRSTESSD